MTIHRQIFIIALIFPVALAISSCRKAEEPAPPPVREAPPDTVVEEPAVPPVAEVEAPAVEEEILTPAEWEALYGPEDGGKVILLDDIYVALGTGTPGTGGNETFRWDDAMEYAAGLDWLGKTDWRLPTDDELVKIYQNRDLLDGFAEANHWTSSLHHNIPDRAAAVIDFTTGRKRYWNKNGSFPIRLVRTK